MLRNIVHIAEYMENMGYDSEYRYSRNGLDKAEQLLSKLTKKLVTTKVNNIKEQTLNAYVDIENIINYKGELLGLETGLQDLDSFYRV